MAMKEWGPRLIAVTSGAKGAQVLDCQKQELIAMAASKHKVADATGAGDAFFSGLVAGWQIFGENARQALKLAVLNSGSVVTEVGAQNGLMGARDIEKYFKIKAK